MPVLGREKEAWGHRNWRSRGLKKMKVRREEREGEMEKHRKSQGKWRLIESDFSPSTDLHITDMTA